MRIFFSLAAAFMFLYCSSCTSGSKPSAANSFALKPEKGKKYEYEITKELVRIFEKDSDRIEHVITCDIELTGDDGKLKTLDAEYRNFKMNMTLNGKEQISIDALEKTSPLAGNELQANPMEFLKNAFSAVVGKKITLKVDQEGKIYEAFGFDEIFKSVISEMDLAGEAKTLAEASLRDEFNEDRIKEIFTPVFCIYPGREIKTRDNWEKTYELKRPFSAKYTTQFVVRAFEGDNVVLDVKTNIEPLSDDSEERLLGMKIKGIQSGVIKANIKSGLVVEGELIQDIESAGSLPVKIKVKSKIKGREQT